MQRGRRPSRRGGRRTSSGSPDPGQPGTDIDAAGAQEEPVSPIDRLLGAVDRPGVTEIMINGPGPVWIERSGRIEPTDHRLDQRSLGALIEAVLAPLGLRVDRTSPIVDARLPDGSRVNVVVRPLAIDGPVVSIRRFPTTVLPLARFGPLPVVSILSRLVADRASILVVGPTSSGKTSLVASLAALVDRSERIVCIEDTAELPIEQPNQVRLEARPANSEGVGEVTLRRLVFTALRMRPDRLVVGEVRGAEAFDLLLALTSGHRGCLTTCHAADAAGGLRRLETLAALAGSGLEPDRLRGLVVDGVDAVVVTGRWGPRRGIESVCSIVDGELVPLWPALAARRPPPPLHQLDRGVA